jgi:hypothetical protein
MDRKIDQEEDIALKGVKSQYDINAMTILLIISAKITCYLRVIPTHKGFAPGNSTTYLRMF